MSRRATSTLATAVRALRRAGARRGRGEPLVLAVSGGLDSMVLLHLAARDPWVRERCTVATFDHGTGAHAKAAVRLVRATARSLGIPVVSGSAARSGSSEAEWRDMRWRFLREVAQQRDARIVTGHTRDDQVETVVMRILRGASFRGIAALYADDDIVRPLLSFSRRSLDRYAATHAVPFVEDPTNTDRRYLRNRVRHDLLPALRSRAKHFDRDFLRLARRAARLRRQTERAAARLTGDVNPGNTKERVLRVADLRGIDAPGLAVLWPAIVAQLGVALDRRGVERATQFCLSARAGQRAQCANRITLERTRSSVLVRRDTDSVVAHSGSSGVELGGWVVRRVTRLDFEAHVRRSGSVWGIALSNSLPYEIRRWRPGDRIRIAAGTRERRIKRYFSEKSIPVTERRSWPVVVAGGEILWVPGVIQPSTTVGEFGNHLTYLVCERRVG